MASETKDPSEVERMEDALAGALNVATEEGAAACVRDLARAVVRDEMERRVAVCAPPGDTERRLRMLESAMDAQVRENRVKPSTTEKLGRIEYRLKGGENTVHNILTIVESLVKRVGKLELANDSPSDVGEQPAPAPPEADDGEVEPVAYYRMAAMGAFQFWQASRPERPKEVPGNPWRPLYSHETVQRLQREKSSAEEVRDGHVYGDRPMKRRHEGRWAMAESLPVSRPHESISPSNYPLPAGAVVEVGGDGFLPRTLKVRPSPYHSWRDVWEDAVRPVEQEELGL